jgi:streptogramin lyase
VSPPTGQPFDIAKGPDGTIWFTEFAASEIGEFNPATDTLSYFPTPTPNAGPEGITAGPDGNMWFAEWYASKVAYINPTTDEITEILTSTPDAQPSGITTGPDGNIWFTEFGADKIAQITISGHGITEFKVPTIESNPTNITTGSDGNLWFTEEEISVSKIGMFNPVTQKFSEFPTPTPDSVPLGIAAGPDGNLWFTEASANQIGMINPTTHHFVETPVPTSNSHPYGIAAGPDGNLWFTEYNTSKIGEINPTTLAITETSTPIPNSAPNGITAGPDNNLWFTEQGAGKIAVARDTGLVVTAQPPASVTAGTGFGLTVQDEYDTGVVDTAFNGSVTVALANDPTGGTLGGTLTATASEGVAIFSGLTIDTAGSGYTLQVSGSGPTAATTSAIKVSPGPASQLVIHTQPSATATAGQAFATQPVIYEEDRYGNLETTDSSTVVTAALNSGAGPLQGTLTATVSGGVAKFTNLADDRAETITLKFSGGGLTSGPSTAIVVRPAAASQLAIHTQPSATATAGQAFATQPVIYEEDQYGNLETSDSSTVETVALNSGVGPLLGKTTTTVAGGVATFTNLADSTAETITLKFTSGSLTPVTSNPIVVAAPPTAESLSPSSATEGGGAFLLTVNGTAFTSNATVDWNGTSLATASVSSTQLLAIVPASDLSEEGSASITVSCPGTGVSNALIFTVADAALSSIPVPISTSEGKSFSGVVATFTDADPNGTTTDYTATILWGDSTISAGTIAVNGTSGFKVSGTHVYKERDTYAVNVLIEDQGGSYTVASTTATVADYSLTDVSGRSIAANIGQSFQGVVGSFTDSAPGRQGTGEYTATIAWGDGTSSAGVLVAAGGTNFNIQGTHTYKRAGTFTLQVAFADHGGATGSATGTATVSPRSGSSLGLEKSAQPSVDGLAPAGGGDGSGRFIDGAYAGTPGGNTVAVLSNRGATVEASASGAIGGQAAGIVAIVDTLFERDALTGLTTAHRARHDRATASR